MTRASYAVVGGGAIGGTLAFHLAKAGHPVTVVDADAEHVAAIRDDGLTIERDGVRERVAVKAATPEEFDGPLERVLLAVKAQATESAADWIAPRLTEDGYVVSIQNGFNESLLAERIGWPRTVAAFVNIFADRLEPGVIADGGAGALVLGEPGGQPVSPRVSSLVEDLRAWGPAQASDNVEGFLWAKAGFGAMLAATALADDAMADLIDRHHPAIHALGEEVFDVASGLAIRLEAFDAFTPHAFVRGADPTARAAATDHLTAWLRTQPKTRSGIWRDLAVRRRQVEVTTHYATVLAEATRLNVATPVLRAVLDNLRDLEHDPAGMSETRLTTLDTLALS
ncbi:ketopantoate reductase family protein [Amycolatopsis magusensis]|uniref:ketopantoate reductase family protein n=1 Tax=Amycolatopsis magusensis TaxID=882444 RepID=UPI0024A8905F|nr:2-dehydropantoate 2-reductase [Amycolatopsis magusensis]MDI5980522.1 2-dehydropantoate 2-reductase [Amycolatopsis magusensis]